MLVIYNFFRIILVKQNIITVATKGHEEIPGLDPGHLRMVVKYDVASPTFETNLYTSLMNITKCGKTSCAVQLNAIAY